jgi:predicted ester cyclase
MSEENKNVVNRIPLEIFNQGKVDVADEVMAADMIEHMAPTPGLPSGIEGFKMFVQGFRKAFPDLHYEVISSVAEGDMVATIAHASGTMKGDFAGMPASGKSAKWTEMHFSRVADGKCVEHWGVVDRLGMMEGLGFGAGGPPAS